tara:strand:- start:772 stop:891 length:120 start_codon:yes stop_codon:yes gene_type:complete
VKKEQPNNLVIENILKRLNLAMEQLEVMKQQLDNLKKNN